MMADAESNNATPSELNASMSQLSVGNAIEDGCSCDSMLSPFERLPSELFREIVQYVPESVFDLRLVRLIFIYLLISAKKCPN